ncbi:MAG: hydroxyacid dehydrogenase, partial [Chloroflexi bacterium]|nr:hydroxyacid dehydrogenase [Chloroflexota bacterium]
MFHFLLTEPIHEEGVKILQAEGNVRVAKGTDEETLIAELRDIDGVILRARGRMTRRVLESAPRLKVIGRHGVGVDNVDLEAATELGIQVVNTPHAVTEGVVEHTVGLMLDVAKRITYADRRLRAGDWEVRYRLSGRELRGRTLGIIGFGR